MDAYPTTRPERVSELVYTAMRVYPIVEAQIQYIVATVTTSSALPMPPLPFVNQFPPVECLGMHRAGWADLATFSVMGATCPYA